MSLVIELPKETEEILEQEASKHGLHAPEYAQQLIERQLPQPQQTPKRPSARGKYAWVRTRSEEFARRKQEEIEERKPRDRVSAYGKYAHLKITSDDVAANKQKEIELEDRGWKPDSE